MTEICKENPLPFFDSYAILEYIWKVLMEMSILW